MDSGHGLDSLDLLLVGRAKRNLLFYWSRICMERLVSCWAKWESDIGKSSPLTSIAGSTLPRKFKLSPNATSTSIHSLEDCRTTSNLDPGWCTLTRNWWQRLTLQTANSTFHLTAKKQAGTKIAVNKLLLSRIQDELTAKATLAFIVLICIACICSLLDAQWLGRGLLLVGTPTAKGAKCAKCLCMNFGWLCCSILVLLPQRYIVVRILVCLESGNIIGQKGAHREHISPRSKETSRN